MQAVGKWISIYLKKNIQAFYGPTLNEQIPSADERFGQKLQNNWGNRTRMEIIYEEILFEFATCLNELHY